MEYWTDSTGDSHVSVILVFTIVALFLKVDKGFRSDCTANIHACAK